MQIKVMQVGQLGTNLSLIHIEMGIRDSSRAVMRSWAERISCSSSLSSWVMNRSQLVRVCLRM